MMGSKTSELTQIIGYTQSEEAAYSGMWGIAPMRHWLVAREAHDVGSMLRGSGADQVSLCLIPTSAQLEDSTEFANWEVLNEMPSMMQKFTAHNNSHEKQ
jgi:hypothetical protein